MSSILFLVFLSHCVSCVTSFDFETESYSVTCASRAKLSNPFCLLRDRIKGMGHFPTLLL